MTDPVMLEWKTRTLFSMGAATASITLKRPSWFRPVKRVLWVHQYGPHQPTVVKKLGKVRNFGVIKVVA